MFLERVTLIHPLVHLQPRLVMLERPPGGATMRWPVRRGLLSSICAPGRDGANHCQQVPPAAPAGPDAEPSSQHALWPLHTLGLGPGSPLGGLPNMHGVHCFLLCAPLRPWGHPLAALTALHYFLPGFMFSRHVGQHLVPTVCGRRLSASTYVLEFRVCSKTMGGYPKCTEEEFEAQVMHLEGQSWRAGQPGFRPQLVSLHSSSSYRSQNSAQQCPRLQRCFMYGELGSARVCVRVCARTTQSWICPPRLPWPDLHGGGTALFCFQSAKPIICSDLLCSLAVTDLEFQHQAQRLVLNGYIFNE